MKSCTNPNCSKENPQPLSNFPKDKTIKSGVKARCNTCTNIRARENRKKNPEAYRERDRKRYLKNKQKRLDLSNKWRKNNPEKRKVIVSRWAKNNSSKINAKTMRRIAQKNNACPKWLTKEQHKEIAEFYKKARELNKNSPEPMQVDHIIPLRSDLICGLHVPWNLQILPRSVNARKGNKIIV